MPHSIAFDAAHKRITIVVTAPVSEQDALDCLREVRTDPEFAPAYGILINLLSADRPPTVSEGFNIAKVLNAFFPAQKIAFVRHPLFASEGSEILREASSVSAIVQNFSDLGAAESWLAG